MSKKVHSLAVQHESRTKPLGQYRPGQNPPVDKTAYQNHPNKTPRAKTPLPKSACQNPLAKTPGKKFYLYKIHRTNYPG